MIYIESIKNWRQANEEKYFNCIYGVFITSCVNMSQQPNIVSRNDVQRQQSITLGTIIDITNVTIEGDRRLGLLQVQLLVGLLVRM